MPRGTRKRQNGPGTATQGSSDGESWMTAVMNPAIGDLERQIKEAGDASGVGGSPCILVKAPYDVYCNKPVRMDGYNLYFADGTGGCRDCVPNKLAFGRVGHGSWRPTRIRRAYASPSPDGMTACDRKKNATMRSTDCSLETLDIGTRTAVWETSFAAKKGRRSPERTQENTPADGAASACGGHLRVLCSATQTESVPRKLPTRAQRMRPVMGKVSGVHKRCCGNNCTATAQSRLDVGCARE
ncbi:hypothetical protein FB45DRAFT_1126359 [Roridomyces roridus]|uniref:Uncharacterized protein n=1 Tax=Roridomyces roridus TaxID=1738132 RepID=A0AAD7CAV0_9AGAR|nr:hypothetical protein FB45DRAFT_1126359 [Roridomyces roridus]